MPTDKADIWADVSRHFQHVLPIQASRFGELMAAGAKVYLECIDEAVYKQKVWTGTWRFFLEYEGRIFVLCTVRDTGPRNFLTANGVMNFLATLGVRKMDLPMHPDEGLGVYS